MPDHWTTAVSPNGWTDGYLGIQSLERNFGPYTRPAEGDDEYTRLLIYDGHESHIIYEFVEHAYAHRIKCLCLPVHSTHLLQPLDVVTFGQYAAEYSKALDNASRRGITGVDKELLSSSFKKRAKWCSQIDCVEVLSVQLAYIHTTPKDRSEATCRTSLAGV